MGFGGAANFGTGHIAEVLVYNKILSVSEKSQIQTYLNNKWGITTNGPEYGFGGMMTVDVGTIDKANELMELIDKKNGEQK
jgi:hypothetical protein